MKRFIGVIILVVLLIGGLVAFGLSRQKQDVRSHAAESTPTLSGDTLALVGDQPITSSMVEQAAREQYAPDAITDDVKKLVLDVLIERSILDQEAAKDHLSVSADEIAASGLGDTQSAKYELLKKKIIAQNTESREAFVIGYWIPPSDYGNSLTPDQTAKIAAIRKDGKVALEEAQTRMAGTEDALSIAESLVQKYPSLKDTLGVNGYILARTTDQTLLTTPRVYTKDPTTIGQPFFDTLFSMQEGEVKTALADKDAGGSVIKVVKVTHAQYANYDEFLKAKKDELVKTK